MHCVHGVQDLDMYYAPTDTAAMARTSNLNEELGQVSTGCYSHTPSRVNCWAHHLRSAQACTWGKTIPDLGH